MIEWAMLLKGVAWFMGLVFLPFAGWLGGKYLKTQDSKFGEHEAKIETLSRRNQDLSERLIKVEANAVTKGELLDLLRRLEDSIEDRFNKSFERLEVTLNKIIDKLP